MTVARQLLDPRKHAETILGPQILGLRLIRSGKKKHHRDLAIDSCLLCSKLVSCVKSYFSRFRVQMDCRADLHLG